MVSLRSQIFRIHSKLQVMSPDLHHKYTLSSTITPPIPAMATASTGRIHTSASLKFEYIPKLLGQSNYITWSNAWEIAFYACDWWEIVNGEIARPEIEEKGKNPDGASASKASSAEDPSITRNRISSQALHMLSSSVESSILYNIIHLRSAPEAWTTMKASK